MSPETGYGFPLQTGYGFPLQTGYGFPLQTGYGFPLQRAYGFPLRGLMVVSYDRCLLHGVAFRGATLSGLQG